MIFREDEELREGFAVDKPACLQVLVLEILANATRAGLAMSWEGGRRTMSLKIVSHPSFFGTDFALFYLKMVLTEFMKVCLENESSP